jgi:hypothetical protein
MVGLFRAIFRAVVEVASEQDVQNTVSTNRPPIGLILTEHRYVGLTNTTYRSSLRVADTASTALSAPYATASRSHSPS